jgi:hypothetical protein
MGHAIGVKDSDRLPWLETYRAPVKTKKGGLGGALAAAALVAVAGISSLLLVRGVNVPQETPQPQARPQASVTLPPPDALKLEVPQFPLKVEAAPAPSQAAPVYHAKAVTRSPRRAPTVRKRRITATPDRTSFESVLSEQIATLPPPAPPVIQTAPPPVIPVRPAVNPAASVVKGKTAQLGVYLTARQAEAAWRSAIKDYTFLVTMPKDISPVRMGKSTRRFYRLQLGTPSRKHAHQLCRNLRQTGRACTVA